MKTSTDAINDLQAARTATKAAEATINDLLAAHNYQDVALLMAKAAQSLLDAATAFMESEDEAALDALEAAEDIIDEFYDIIDGDLRED